MPNTPAFNPDAIAPYLEIRSAKSPAISPDGEWLAYLSDETGYHQIWLKARQGGAAWRLTDMREPVNSIAFNPKSRDLLFTMDCGGDERYQLWLVPEASGVPVALTSEPATVHLWGAWSPDGGRIAYAANSRSAADMDIYVMDVKSRTSKRVFEGNGMREVLAFFPDGNALLVRESLRSASDQELFKLDIESGRLEALLPHAGRARYVSARMLKDGSGGLSLCDQGRDFVALMQFSAGGGEPVLVREYPSKNIDAMALSPAQDRIACIINDEGWSRICLIGRDGKNERVYEGHPKGVISSLAFTPDGSKLVFPLEGAALPAGIWQLDIESGSFVQIVQASGAGVDRDGFIEPEVERFESFDGRLIPAFVYRPATQAPVHGYPVLFIIHGGPEMQWKPDFRADVQFLLSQGVMVVAPNVRGSTGYGRAFHELDDREKRMDSVADMTAIRRAIGTRSDVDDTRIGVFGRSYGGFMVLSALTEDPDLWKLGADFYGVCNFRTHLLATGPWGRQPRAAEYGEPSVMGEMLDRFSPINRIGKMKAPLFLVHANRDPRVPIGESETVNSCLTGRGHSVEYLRINHEGHGFARIENRRTVFSALARFLHDNL